MTLARVLLNEFDHGWGMLAQATTSIPADQWRAGDIDHLRPARLVLHAVETVDYYLRDAPEGFAWGYRFDADWEGAPPEKLPDQAQMRAYLDEVRNRVAAAADALDDARLLARDDRWPLFENRLQRAVYVIRHTHQHIGEINAELRRRRLPRLKWDG